MISKYMKNGMHIREDGAVCYYKDDAYHREDGPAIDLQGSNGTRCWLINDKYHRLDGPAVEDYNGYKEWHINGEYVFCSFQEEFENSLPYKIWKLKVFK